MHIVVDSLKFEYPGVKVLDDVTFETDSNELIAILGPNGVGKSTLIHCMNRILSPTGGSVLVDDVPVSDYKLRDLAKVLGYVPYASKDSFPMTVIDTVLIGRNPHSSFKVTEKDLQIVEGALRLMGIEDLAMRVFNELSAGQRQKVMLARGLVQEPKAILLDEPTANLDIKHQYGVTKILKSISHDKGMLVVMICHDLNIAAKYADRIILMSEGTIYAVGAPSEVITEDNIRRVYGVECRVIDDNGSPHVIVVDEMVDVDASV